MTVNFIAIFVCAIISMVVGFIWYGNILFGKKWMEIMGAPKDGMPMTDAMKKSMMGSYLVQFLLSVLTFYILANYIAGWKPAEGALGGVINAFWIWLGFVMPVQAGGALWSGKTKQLSWAMFLIGAGYQLVTLLIAGALLAIW
jgi:hypothetical protein